MVFYETSFTIDENNHEHFMNISGDTNPIHSDNQFAKSAGFEKRLIHGINSVLNILELISGQNIIDFSSVATCTAAFHKPVFEGDILKIFVEKNKDNSIDISARVGITTCFDITLDYGDHKLAVCDGLIFTSTERRKKPILQIQSQPKEYEKIHINIVPSDITKAYPSLSSQIGMDRVMSMASISTIVGMYWPGEFSFCSKMAFSFNDSPTKDINYKIDFNDERLRLTILNVTGSGVTAKVHAFFRPTPIVETAYTEILEKVETEQFANQKALIIGGSKGLGATTAKIIAAGGGTPTITYASSKKSAHAVMNDIIENTGNCDMLPLNVLNQDDVNSIDVSQYNVVYFFATPQIFTRKTKIFDPKLYQNFASHYCDGLLKVIERFIEARKKVIIFNPSTTDIEEKTPGIEEYYLAKQLGEEMLALIASHHTDNVKIISKRLPKVKTNQTTSILSTATTTTEAVIQPYILEITAHITDNFS
ncbi:MaoC/PaaZ C-terminal domain-containing protein [Kordiimonas sp. SCSIO 12610]|uniref:MaoC/PaaZ C-terminal domain-containing protein n=1 Tax=Kordiimonas sp. SCSIO 12610 TaxID=2829597 RepID=UPI00210E2FED|nr:MaoC/PaaZ C-terminal domain-containing protein [Kordiimonas sp. SCSIO 12610]UTW55882.1 hypothetical protein KFF44_03030 [Kordiimonas sp. SCSIO 12610]